MVEELENRIKFLEAFYYLAWDSGWISTDVTYEIGKEAEKISGFNLDGEVV